MKLLLLAALLTVLDSFVDSAVVRSEEFSEQLQKIVNMHPDNVRTQRSTENDERPVRNCDENNPCGWMSYYSPTRRVHNDFMANTCKCPDETYKCVRSGESISTRAYVYHCRQNTTADDIEGETSEDTDYVS
ncbi:uncharacterized protein LOC108625629 [Ceratina calcarata]|uniref:Uncharacterized protein LOC108625629 n=1 Tax=Ceratina calcarata TaxID=156304 RepID=A0AAJ7J0Q5_9HYME|nr:uncharacterized protein LOC108625629 [Ceratina calcarata]